MVAQLEGEEEPWVPSIVDMTLVSRAEAGRGPGLGEWGWGMPWFQWWAHQPSGCLCTGISVLRPVAAPHSHLLSPFWTCHVVLPSVP